MSKKVTEAREFNEQNLMSLLIITDREAEDFVISRKFN